MSALLQQMKQDAPGVLYLLDEASGNAKDYGSLGLDATPTGITYQYASLLGSPRMRWDSDTDKVVSAASTAAAINPTNALTLVAFYRDEAWATGAERPLIHKAFTSHVAPFYEYNFTMYRQPGGNYQPVLYVSIGGTLRDSTTGTVTTIPGYAIGDHMAVAQWNGTAGTMQFFIDGEPLAAAASITGGVGSSTAYNTPVVIGNYGNVNQGWRGMIGPAGVYTSLLSADRIKSIWKTALRHGVMVG